MDGAATGLFEQDKAPSEHPCDAPNGATVNLGVWRKVELGTGKSFNEYREALKRAGCRIGHWANAILDVHRCAQQGMPIELVNISVSAFGWVDGANYKDICARGVELGFELCPAEVGPALRLMYKDQPYGESLYIAMEAVVTADGLRNIFMLNRDEHGYWLCAGNGDLAQFYQPHHRFLFVRRAHR